MATLSYKSTNIEDVSKMRDILNKEKISKPIMTIYEFDKIIGMRTQMLASGAPMFVKHTDLKISSNMELRQIALQELREGKLPVIVERVLPNNKKERYRIRDLDLVAVRDRMR
jgi:DNA-directed RNA polymerase subunit K/omega